MTSLGSVTHDSTPYFFGRRKSPLFGVEYPAASTQQAVVVCGPVGQEAVRSHWAIRNLATQIARRGAYVLRFDYFGNGESAGTFAEARFERWLEDVEIALDEALDSSGSAHVTLVGARLGASLAAEVARRRSEVRRLVLWDPVISGARYLEELRAVDGLMRRYWLTPQRPSQVQAGREELCGFEASAELLAEIAALRLDAGAPPAAATILVGGPRERREFDAFAGWTVEEQLLGDDCGWADPRRLETALVASRSVEAVRGAVLGEEMTEDLRGGAS